MHMCVWVASCLSWERLWRRVFIDVFTLTYLLVCIGSRVRGAPVHRAPALRLSDQGPPLLRSGLHRRRQHVRVTSLKLRRVQTHCEGKPGFVVRLTVGVRVGVMVRR